MIPGSEHEKSIQLCSNSETALQMLCNTKIQYLLFCKASRYCLLALHGTTDVHCHCTAPGQCLLDLIFIQVHCTNLIFVQSQHHGPMPLQKNILPCRVKIQGRGRGAVIWYHQRLCTIRWSKCEITLSVAPQCWGLELWSATLCT